MKLTDFGISQKLKDADLPCFASSGTLDYMAPEILSQNHSHGIPSDVFAAGIVLLEFANLSLSKPNSDSAKMEKALKDNKANVGDSFRDVIMQMCKYQVNDRIGSVKGSKNYMKDVKKHVWFNGFDWKSFDDETMQPPFVPPSGANVNENGGMEDLGFSADGEEKVVLKQEFQDKFKDYCWNNKVGESLPESTLPTIARSTSAVKASATNASVSPVSSSPTSTPTKRRPSMNQFMLKSLHLHEENPNDPLCENHGPKEAGVGRAISSVTTEKTEEGLKVQK